uniref:Tankyrase 1-binding protein C-terminal domain-containing protein n=1 Tax=Poecilia formosa TaxID=48698 RepID=A0A087XQX4_POEFO
MDTTIEASQSGGLPSKPSLPPKPTLAPKPFSLQKNSTIRSFKAPKTVSKTAPIPKSEIEQSETENPTAVTVPAKKLPQPILASAPKPQPASALPKSQPEASKTSEALPQVENSLGSETAALDPATETTPTKEEPKSEPAQKDIIQTNHKPPTTAVASPEQKDGEEKQSDTPVSVSQNTEESSSNSPSTNDSFYQRGSVRKRLPKALTSKFESGGVPLPRQPFIPIPKPITKDESNKPESSDSQPVHTTPEPPIKEIDTDAEDFTGGTSIQNRISQLMDYVPKPEATTKRKEPEITNGIGDVKEKIKNWASETGPEDQKVEKSPQAADRVCCKGFQKPACTIRLNLETPRVEVPAAEETPTQPVDSRSTASSSTGSQIEPPEEAPFKDKPLENPTETSAETDKPKEDDVQVQSNHSAAADEKNLAELKKKKMKKRRSVRFGTVVADDGTPPVVLGPEPESSEDENQEENAEVENKEKEEDAVSTPVYKRVGIFQRKDDKTQSQETLKHQEQEEERKRRNLEEQRQKELKDEEERLKLEKDQRQKEEEETRKYQQELMELMRIREKEQELEKEKLRQERKRRELEEQRQKELKEEEERLKLEEEQRQKELKEEEERLKLEEEQRQKEEEESRKYQQRLMELEIKLQMEKERADQMEESQPRTEENDKREEKLINFDAEEPPTSPSSHVSKNTESLIDVVYDDFSIQNPVLDVAFDDFSVKPRRRTFQPRRETAPISSGWRVEPPRKDDLLVSFDSEPQETQQENEPKPQATLLFPTPAPETPEEEKVKRLLAEFGVKEEGDEEAERPVADQPVERKEEEMENGAQMEDESEEEDNKEPQVNSYITNDEDKLIQTLLHSEQDGISEQASGPDSPTVPDASSEDLDNTDSKREMDLDAVCENSAPLLDNSSQKSKAVLGRRLTRSRPSRSLRLESAEAATVQMSVFKGNDEKDNQSDSEEEPPESKPVYSSTQRVPMFPGLNPKDLLIGIKKKTGGVAAEAEERSVEDRREQETESQNKKAAPSPSQASGTPRVAPRLAGAKLVLP